MALLKDLINVENFITRKKSELIGKITATTKYEISREIQKIEAELKTLKQTSLESACRKNKKELLDEMKENKLSTKEMAKKYHVSYGIINRAITSYKENVSTSIKELNKESDKKEAERILNEFLSSEYTKRKDFLNKFSINVSFFESLLSKVDQELKGKVEEKITKGSKQNFKRLTILINKTSKNIQDKNFNLLDYYLSSSINLNTLASCRIEGNNQIKEYIENNPFLFVRIKISYITQLYESYNGHEVTQAEKEEAIRFLQKNKIPLIYGTYNTCIKRLICNELPI